MRNCAVCPGQTVLQTGAGDDDGDDDDEDYDGSGEQPVKPVNIKSPNFPGKLRVAPMGPSFSVPHNACITDNYDVNTNKEWTIVAPSGEVVRLVFDTFNTESGYDNVKVYDGCTVKAPLIKSYSGDNRPDPILSTGNVLHMTFRSDSSGTKRGFSGTASAIDLAGKLILCCIFSWEPAL